MLVSFVSKVGTRCVQLQPETLLRKKQTTEEPLRPSFSSKLLAAILSQHRFSEDQGKADIQRRFWAVSDYNTTFTNNAILTVILQSAKKKKKKPQTLALLFWGPLSNTRCYQGLKPFLLAVMWHFLYHEMSHINFLWCK